MNELLLRRRVASKKILLTLTGKDFTWMYGNIEVNGTISNYKNGVSMPFAIPKYKKSKIIQGDSRYTVLVAMYSGNTLVLRGFLRKAPTSSQSDVLENGYVGGDNIRVMLFDKPTLDYCKKSTFIIEFELE